MCMAVLVHLNPIKDDLLKDDFLRRLENNSPDVDGVSLKTVVFNRGHGTNVKEKREEGGTCGWFS